jgi:polysaccharide export outer membrane protein
MNHLICALILAGWIIVLAAGCASAPCATAVGDPGLPRELCKTTMPHYRIEPPDVLTINVGRLVPIPPYRLEPLDTLQVEVVKGIVPNEPVAGVFVVNADGNINLGLSYGTVRVAGLTVEEAQRAIELRVQEKSGAREERAPRSLVTLVASRPLQQISGPHLVEQDGTVNLGRYGCVRVAGMTVEEARQTIEERLGQFLQNPEIALHVGGFNSKVYYVILDGGGYGEQIFRFPVTGNETVLDALSQTNGLPASSSKRRIWISRPTPPESGCDQVLPVDYVAITRRGNTTTNYQILPGDRVYVQADELILADNWLRKCISPIERLLGVTLLGTETTHSFLPQNGSGGGGGGGF